MTRPRTRALIDDLPPRRKMACRAETCAPGAARLHFRGTWLRARVGANRTPGDRIIVPPATMRRPSANAPQRAGAAQSKVAMRAPVRRACYPFEFQTREPERTAETCPCAKPPPRRAELMACTLLPSARTAMAITEALSSAHCRSVTMVDYDRSAIEKVVRVTAGQHSSSINA
jgi:hypothetical protein